MGTGIGPGDKLYSDCAVSHLDLIGAVEINLCNVRQSGAIAIAQI